MNLHTRRVSIHAMYYKIACEHASAHAARDEELEQLNAAPVGEEELATVLARMEKCYQEREQAAVVAMTFSGMALEAFFYDYAAAELGDNYVKNHLDKLDLKSKYLVYPKLVCGKQPDKGGLAYEHIGRLVSLRNELVHFKSKSFELTELRKASDFHTELHERLRNGVKESIDCVMVVMKELDSLHNKQKFFEQRMKWSVQQ